jgi:hypothetical protein
MNTLAKSSLRSVSLICLTLFPLGPGAKSQTSFPDPPRDLTRVYYISGDSAFLPLPFEAGVTSLNVFAPAKQDEITRVVLKGPPAGPVIAINQRPYFYVFVADKMDPPPHQLVRLTNKGSAREFRISVIKGRKGYAPFEIDSVKLERRVLERLQVETGKGRYIFVNYMQLRPIPLLKPGQYAIIGDSLSDIATFQVR